MNKKQIDKLMEDAIYWHLIGEGYSKFRARIEADRRITKLKLIKNNDCNY